MSTSAQIDANRLNALASHGPVTAAGKAISSLNARSHGLYTAVHNLAPFEREAFDELLAAARLQWTPSNPEEESLVEAYALADFRLKRVQAMECGFVTCSIEKLVESGAIPRPATAEDYGRLYGRVYWEDAYGAKAYHKIFAIESRLQRQVEKLRDRLGAILTARQEAQVLEKKTSSAKLGSFLQKPLSIPFTPPSPVLPPADLPRNTPCPCGSGKKYKRCCGTGAQPHINL